MEDDRTPWDQRPGYLAAIATEVAPGGLTAYRVPRPKGWSSTDVTTFMPGQAEWSTENFSEILYQLKPTKAWFEFRRRGLPPQMEDEHGNLMTEPFPEPGTRPRPLLDFPILPPQISTKETPAFFETVRRWDPRIRWEDITMRMECYNRPTSNTVQMRGTRYFRSTHNMVAWHSYSEPGRRHRLSGKRESVLKNLSAEQIAANTTRGTTPGLINPRLGKAGGFVPFPILTRGQGEAREPRHSRFVPKPKVSLPATTSSQARKVGRPRGRPRKIMPKPVPKKLVDSVPKKLVDYDDSEEEELLNVESTGDDSYQVNLFPESQTTNDKTSNYRGSFSPESQTTDVDTSNYHGNLFPERQTTNANTSNSNQRKRPSVDYLNDEISLGCEPSPRRQRQTRYPFDLPKTDQDDFMLEDPELGRIIPRPNFSWDRDACTWAYFDIEEPHAAPPKAQAAPLRAQAVPPRVRAVPPRVQAAPPRVQAALPRVEYPYSTGEDSSAVNPPMALKTPVALTAQTVSPEFDDFSFSFFNYDELPSLAPATQPDFNFNNHVGDDPFASANAHSGGQYLQRIGYLP